MAKSKQDKKLYSRLRGSGVRRRWRAGSPRSPHTRRAANRRRRPPRDAVARLEASVSELRDHVGRADQRRPRCRRRARRSNARRQRPACKGQQKSIEEVTAAQSGRIAAARSYLPPRGSPRETRRAAGVIERLPAQRARPQAWPLLRCRGASGSDGQLVLRMHRRVFACARSAIRGRRCVRARRRTLA